VCFRGSKAWFFHVPDATSSTPGDGTAAGPGPSLLGDEALFATPILGQGSGGSGTGAREAAGDGRAVRTPSDSTSAPASATSSIAPVGATEAVPVEAEWR
jgi:hypothetical protein